MRKKFIDKVYMRDVLEHVWLLEEQDDLFIAIKYIKKINKPIKSYCNGSQYIGLDDGYSIVEYLPKNKLYNMRVFFDNKNRPLCYYFDVNNGNGLENGMPWYDDLYLDVTMECPTINGFGFYIRLDDEVELKNAKKQSLITDKLYIQAYDTANEIMKELKSQNNELVNRSCYDIIRLKSKLKL